jgi:hypothetical protein
MAIRFVQQKTEQSTSSVSSFTTTAMTVDAGNAIVACMSAARTATTSLVASDSNGDAFTLAIFKVGAPNGGAVSIYVAPVLAGGSTTFTVTPDASDFVSISAQEYSGMVRVSPSEATNSGGPTAGTTASPGAVNPASVNDLYVACWTHNGTTSQLFPTNPSGEGWILRSNLTNTANMPLGSQDLVASGSKTGNRTLSASATWVAAVATFKPLADAYRKKYRPFSTRPGASRFRGQFS